VTDLYPLLAVVGPTGSGKSELALYLASLLNGEIVNCDSVQVHAGLDIGSAKTPPAQRLGIPHHLFDLIAPQEEMTAGDYARVATAALEGIRARAALPIIVGGTGFYLRALLDGLSPAPQRNRALRERLASLAQRRPAALHRFLTMRDAAAAARIHANDHQKLIRAIEMAGQIKDARQKLQGFRVLKIGLNPDRAALYEKLNRRCQWMFENGLLAETGTLLAQGASPTGKALTTLGYRQAVAVLTQGVSVSDAVADCQLGTRHYAKRQITWFRAEPDVCWLNGFGNEEHIQKQAMSLVSNATGEARA
jgi:tRNA dimethylallyltransferase